MIIDPKTTSIQFSVNWSYLLKALIMCTMLPIRNWVLHCVYFKVHKAYMKTAPIATPVNSAPHLYANTIETKVNSKIVGAMLNTIAFKTVAIPREPLSTAFDNDPV